MEFVQIQGYALFVKRAEHRRAGRPCVSGRYCVIVIKFSGKVLPLCRASRAVDLSRSIRDYCVFGSCAVISNLDLLAGLKAGVSRPKR